MEIKMEEHIMDGVGGTWKSRWKEVRNVEFEIPVMIQMAMSTKLMDV